MSDFDQCPLCDESIDTLPDHLPECKSGSILFENPDRTYAK